MQKMLKHGFSYKEKAYLKSLGRRSTRLHFEHSAIFLSLPFSKSVFIITSPPHEQKNLWVDTVVREFLLAPAIVSLRKKILY